MNKLFKQIMAVAVLGMAGVPSLLAVQANYQIVPKPENITMTGGSDFAVSSSIKILYPQGNEAMERNAQYLADYLKKSTGVTHTVEAGTAGNNAIVLQLGLQSAVAEAYEIKVAAQSVVITGASPAGVFYGIQTLRKSLPIGASTVSLPAATIADSPRFGYRGAHLDVSRHFFSVDEVKTYIDMMALHNMNRLHWHLTDDQGWRIEIKKYPKLVEIGSKRTETVIGHNSGKYDGKPYGGYYTQAQIKDIIDYAAKRYITVVPEIDLPGHMQAALTAYPELGCTGGPYDVWRIWGVSDNVLCAGNDKVLEFINDVLSEVIDLFPSKYIHIGGDECPKTVWETCPKCQARVKALGLTDEKGHSKEEKLQSFVINQAEKFVNSRGRQIIGWDEILEGGLAPNATVMSWRGEGGGIKAAKMKHDVIMTPNTFMYLDYYQSKNKETEPEAIGGYLPLETVYSYEPMSKHLSADEQKYIIGVQANLWTEYIPSFSQVQYMVLPRWAAVSEIQWSKAEYKNYPDFLKRLPAMIGRYASEGYNYCPRVYDVASKIQPNAETGKVDVTLSMIDDSPIYYTLDGTDPTAASSKYAGTIHIDKNVEVKAVGIRADGKTPVLSEKINFSKSTAKSIVANQPLNKQYSYNGPITLVDGQKGNGNYKTGRWIGFIGNDLDVTIDMGKQDKISKVAISTCVEKGDWIFDARSMKVEVSTDGKKYTTVASESYPEMLSTDRNGIYDHVLSFKAKKARYVHVVVESEKAMPAWHGGKGKRAFLFVDEVSVD